jgi:hypothetical protein
VLVHIPLIVVGPVTGAVVGFLTATVLVR